MAWELSQQSKVYTLTILDVLNVAGADIMLVTIAHYEKPVGRRLGFIEVTQRRNGFT